MKRCRISSLLLTCALPVVACGSDSDRDLPVHLEVQAVPDTVVTTESGLIGGLADWVVHADGSILVLDFQSRQIHVIDSTGRPLQTFGRRGAGPGEMEQPAAVYLSGGSLTVVDPGNGRLQDFALDGRSGSSQAIPECAIGPSAPALGPRGVLVRPTLGFDTALAIVCSSTGVERARIGELLAPRQAVVDMVQMRVQIRRGEVPGLLLNAASAVVGNDGAVWLMVSAAKQVERYDSLGERSFRITIEEPEFEAVRAAWIERNTESDLPGISALNYFLRAREVRGDLWILTNVAGRPVARLVVVTDEGNVKRRLDFTRVRGAGDFAVDENGGWVYFYIPSTAEVVRVALGAASHRESVRP